ncbi:MAG: helix-turn-helix domain-containing protein [Clostridia bacterium]|nr:helix-turn-helix domain-containing protein [Clostridia bacterium]
MDINLNKIKSLRKRSGMTQEQLAERIGVSRQAIAKWECGDSVPDLHSCVALARTFGTTVDALICSYDDEDGAGDGKHVFGIARVNDKGQITLPVQCRKTFGIEPGDLILVLGDENKGIAMVKMGKDDVE